jgi:putative transposase
MMRKSETLPTIWEIPDDLWERIEPVILELDPPKAKGRKRVNQRKMLEGVIFRMRSGCQWNHLPRELGDDSTIHRTFQRWVEGGVLEGIWAVLIEECEELGGVNWEWQSADCSMGKARFGGALLDAIPRTGARLGARKASWSTRQVGH